MIRSAVFAAALAVAAPVMAADLGVKKPAPVAPVSAACKETKGLPADAFGFASGSDVADLGAWGVGFDNTYAAGGRGGKSFGYVGTLQASGSFLPCLEVGPYVYYGLSGFKPYGGLGRTGTLLGGGVEMKYKLLGRATHGVGLTLAMSPNFGAYNGFSIYGGHNTVFNNSYRLLADAELVKGKLYGAFNLELFQSAYTNTLPGFRNLSQFNVRGALAYAATDALYVGAEASYQVAKTGMWMDGLFRGNAVYVGPTFFWQINDKFTLNGTWAYQIAGNDKAGPGHKLGTGVFPLHQARLKLAYAF
ncbi:MAG TPA: hypothetical protein PLE50_00430 [Rhabdaerophilum sp.]|nr:hypothetical protein [Rhabdaerophilum sp.]